MRVTLKDHFIVMSAGKGPCFVAPHAAIAFRKPSDYQDEGTHYIAYKMALNGGKAIISSVTRERDIGIDFYRNPPTQEIAISNYPLFKGGGRGKKEFRKKYAWAARNTKEHRRKRRIFHSFWREIGKSAGPVLFMHRQFLNPIRHPSIMDIVPFNHKVMVKKRISAANRKHSGIFAELLPLYKDSFRFKTQRILFRKSFGKRANMNVFNGIEPRIEKRVTRFREKLKEMPYIKITCMRNFKGKSVRGLVKEYLSDVNAPILQVEMSEFLTKEHPEIAIHLLNDLLKRIEKSG